MDEEQASERIAAAFEAGVAPWSRSDRLGFTCAMPVDARSEQPFRGVDTWLLELAAIEGEYRSSSWATVRDWRELGAIVVRPGGTEVRSDDLRYNLEQVEVRPGWPVASLDRLWVARKTMPDYVMAERVLEASGARVVPDDCCRYVVHRVEDRDFIGMLPLAAFGGDQDRYWAVLFHELIHWEVLRSRRQCWNPDPSPGELIAEVGAAILTTRCGIPMGGELDRDCDHVRAWIEGIRFHHGYLTFALPVAELTADLLLCLAGYET